MLQGKPVEAEQALISARKFGNFPTLQYEIASARLAAGFFREAAEELTKSFELADGKVATMLGGRVRQSADSFTKAIEMERRASIFAPQAADSAEESTRLKALMELSGRLAAETKDEAAIVEAAENFAGGSDNMSVHRKLYAANLLLQSGVAIDEAGKLSSSAVAGLDRSLDVANPGAAVMAGELYEARNVSFSRDEFLLIPEVPKQTLNSLMRGRVEETTGLALLRKGKAADATIRFRRALTVLPANSAWWRSAMWNLGSSLAAEGKDQEALDSMIASYAIDKPNVTRYILIEQLWTKVNGNRDGMEAKIGPNPMPNFTAAAKPEATPEPSQSPAVEPVVAASTDANSATAAEVRPAPEASPSPEAATESVKATPSPEVSPTPEVVSEPVKPTPTPETSPTPEMISEPVKSAPVPEVSPSPEVISEKAKASPSPEATPFPEVVSENFKASPTPEVSPSPGLVPENLKASSTPQASPLPAGSVTLPTAPEFVAPGPAQHSVAKTEPVKGGKPLFEPVIITIPKTTADTKREPEARSGDESKSGERTTDTGEPASGNEIARPRIVDGKAVTGELLPCEIGVSQESVSLINNGGSISMLVSIEQGEDIKQVTGASNSPADVEVRLEPEIAAISGRSMYVIRSVSEKTGMYQVTFKAPCGKKNVIVRVR
jgi:tetratricopeptide (TPR) repeat protein